MTRRLLPALALSAFVALPSTAVAAPAELHPAPGDAPAHFKGVPGPLAKKSAKKSSAKLPVVTRVSPKNAKVGDVLVLTGKNFVRGKGKNQIAFYTRKGGAAFARDESASATRIKVRVPEKLNGLLPADGAESRITLRVRGKRLGKRSAGRVSPLIAMSTGAVGGGTGPGGTAACNPQFTNPTSDVDQDLLSDARERELGMNPCGRDSDGDGASDGYEYTAAFDLNTNSSQIPVPYPHKRPYPNALFPDSEVDYDGDGLTNFDEYSLWTKFGNGTLPLAYSDGKQVSAIVAAPTGDPALRHLDMYPDGFLSDDERDADGDGLTNWDEAHGRMTSAWWKAWYDGSNDVLETSYPVTFADPDMLDPDTDGDGLADGADDQDYDGLPNWFEVDRPSTWKSIYVSVGPVNAHNSSPVPVHARYYARTQPFNPCKPIFSKVCHIHPPFGHYPSTEDWIGPLSPPMRGTFPEDV